MKLWHLNRICLAIQCEQSTHIPWISRNIFLSIWPFDWKLEVIWQPGERIANIGPLAFGYYDTIEQTKHEKPAFYNEVLASHYEDLKTI